jgi:hypothetical protein
MLFDILEIVEDVGYRWFNSRESYLVEQTLLKRIKNSNPSKEGLGIGKVGF